MPCTSTRSADACVHTRWAAPSCPSTGCTGGFNTLLSCWRLACHVVVGGGGHEDVRPSRVTPLTRGSRACTVTVGHAPNWHSVSDGITQRHGRRRPQTCCVCGCRTCRTASSLLCSIPCSSALYSATPQHTPTHSHLLLPLIIPFTTPNREPAQHHGQHRAEERGGSGEVRQGLRGALFVGPP